MAISKNATSWYGDNDEDLATYLQQFRAGGYPVTRVRRLSCTLCGNATFLSLVDDDQGVAAVDCLECGARTLVADSAEHLDDAQLEGCACPCGGETFTVSVGYAVTSDNEVRWISVGLRCLNDGALGVYTDWKIDYTPSARLCPPS
ncbi:hypothetical protein COUCH_11600 [Couchioplanes caeruleus]|uniref:hypothetical protein n=1 Tax=Couchioplanes caeruleus TaxID=56438 RepID=UPI0020C018AC|nr:hypothetical protein [Couchioplanes caeruleus]UQU66866.1 hypothetical protein COUCH_11600 [Couchioplanes caeruleus]